MPLPSPDKRVRVYDYRVLYNCSITSVLYFFLLLLYFNIDVLQSLRIREVTLSKLASSQLTKSNLLKGLTHKIPTRQADKIAE